MSSSSESEEEQIESGVIEDRDENEDNINDRLKETSLKDNGNFVMLYPVRGFLSPFL